MEQEDSKRWFVQTLFGKYETIIKERETWESKGYKIVEKDKEVLVVMNNDRRGI